MSLAIGVPVAAFTVYKNSFDISIGKQSQRREEYKFAKDFLEEVKSKPDMHPFAREKGYKAIAPDKQPGVGLRDKLGAKEIEYLLSLKKSELALQNYILGRHYLENIFDNETPKIAFKKQYEDCSSRGLRKNIFFALYWLFAFLAFAPIFWYWLIPIWPDLHPALLLKKLASHNGVTIKNGWGWGTWVEMELIFLVTFINWARLSLGIVTGINRAEELVHGVEPPRLHQELREYILRLKKALLPFSDEGK